MTDILMKKYHFIFDKTKKAKLLKKSFKNKLFPKRCNCCWWDLCFALLKNFIKLENLFME